MKKLILISILSSFVFSCNKTEVEPQVKQSSSIILGNWTQFNLKGYNRRNVLLKEYEGVEYNTVFTNNSWYVTGVLNTDTISKDVTYPADTSYIQYSYEKGKYRKYYIEKTNENILILTREMKLGENYYEKVYYKR